MLSGGVPGLVRQARRQLGHFPCEELQLTQCSLGQPPQPPTPLPFHSPRASSRGRTCWGTGWTRPSRALVRARWPAGATPQGLTARPTRQPEGPAGACVVLSVDWLPFCPAGPLFLCGLYTSSHGTPSLSLILLCSGHPASGATLSVCTSSTPVAAWVPG